MPEASRECEISWFSALCDDDYELLGAAASGLRSSWEHCRDIALAAEAGGYDNLLRPSGYALGIDSVAFAAGIAPLLRRMQLLLAVRMGEMWPPQLARQLATIDQILGGRLTVNIISSALPGERHASTPRYRRTLEIMQVLRALLNGEHVDFHGDFIDVTLDPPRVRPVGGCPPFYFGGLSDATSSPTCGPASAGRGRARAPRSSVIPTGMSPATVSRCVSRGWSS